MFYGFIKEVLNMVERDYSYKGKLEKNVYIKDINLGKNDKGEKEFIYSLNTREQFSLGRFDVETYMHGRCHLFAIVANEITGLPVHILGKPDYHNPSRNGDLSTGVLLSHVFIDIGNNYVWDTQGTRTIDETIDMFAKIEETYYDQIEPSFDLLQNSAENIQRIKAMIKKGYIADFAKEEKESIASYIKDVIAIKGNQPFKAYSETYKQFHEDAITNKIKPA